MDGWMDGWGVYILNSVGGLQVCVLVSECAVLCCAGYFIITDNDDDDDDEEYSRRSSFYAR